MTEPRSKRRIVTGSVGICLGFSLVLANAATAGSASMRARCDQRGVQGIPARAADAPTGHEFAQRVEGLSAAARDAGIRSELLAGNIPDFLRRLAPVTITGTDPANPVELTACVLPDYLAIGSDRDFVFVPMGLEAALEVAGHFGFALPTPNLVDAIYREAAVKLQPLPLPAGDQMRTTAYFLFHNDLIARQRSALRAALGELTAGHKKDLVLSSRLWALPGRVAIYGWHRDAQQPIQPLSTVHGARYADYSHGVRLVSDTVYVNGVRRSIEDVLADSSIAGLLTEEGPWVGVAERLNTLMKRLAEQQVTQSHARAQTLSALVALADE
jgi:hypothetical protein